MFLGLVLIARLLCASDVVDAFIHPLPDEEVSILDSGFRRILRSFSGYVLYGDKPMCIESIHSCPVSLSFDEQSSAKEHFFQILKEWNLSSLDRRYLFLFTQYAGYTHLIVINREAFIKIVNENLALFRYVLDPFLTAEGLLKDLAENQDRFYDIIKDDIALLGILLGYGTNNSIAHRRTEFLLQKTKQPHLKFPYLSCISSNTRPSRGFQTLEAELDFSCSRAKGSWGLSKHAIYPIPCFGCYSNSDESITLLKTYEKNRKDLVAAVEQENFLDTFLERIFTTTSNTVKAPNVKVHKSLFNPKDETQLLNQFGRAILAETKIDGKQLVQFFLNGMRDCENGILSDLDDLSIQRELLPLSLDLRDRKNLENAEKLLTKLSKSKNWVSLAPQNVLYKTLKKGRGSPASSKVQNVVFHYSFYTSDNRNQTTAGTIRCSNLGKLIPGLAHLLTEMKKGEERLAYFHPRYAYGDSEPFPNIAIVAKIQLIGFEIGDREVSIAPLQSMDSRQVSHSDDFNAKPIQREKPTGSYKELLSSYNQLQEKKVYLSGYSFCESIKKAGVSLDSGKLARVIQSSKLRINEEQRVMFVLDFKSHLFHEQYQQGLVPITPFCF
jgi:hypothetical protein